MMEEGGAAILCAQCGGENSDQAGACEKCGAARPSVPAVPVVELPPRTSGKGVASLLLGFFFWAFPFAIGSLVLGHMSLADIRKSEGKLAGRGIAIAGLVLGYVGMATLPVILFVTYVILPKLMASPIQVNESAAITALHTVGRAAESYRGAYANGFPPNLRVLAGAATTDCNHAGLIDGELASGERSGYVFRYTTKNATAAPAKGCAAAGGSGGYTVTADPETRGTTGERSFYADDTGVIRVETGKTASAASAPVAEKGAP